MVLVKICGITNFSDAQAAVDAGANALGLNFYPRSPRFIAKADAARIRIRLPEEVESVGVFVNASAADVAALYRDVRFSAAQLHGDEAPELVAELSRMLKVIKAFGVAADFPLEKLEEFRGAFAFLLDAAQAGQYGGTGHTTDWAVARKAAATHRIILAGGLKAENVGEAIRFVRPYGVDVASGVETKPGRKDHGKLREFIQEVRRAETQTDTPVADEASA
jgi:phosphoribosylanthranilate isomerase